MIVADLEGRPGDGVIGVSDLQIIDGVLGVSLNISLQIVDLIHVTEAKIIVDQACEEVLEGFPILPATAESGDENPW